MSDNAPHIAWPVSLTGSGQLVTVAQDSLDEVAQGIYWIASTEAGTVADLPDAGAPSPAFVRGGRTDEIVDLLRTQEPRAAITAVRDDGADVEIDVALS